MSAQILLFPTPPRFEQMAENLWIMRLDDSPEAQAQMDRLVEQLRRNNYVVPDYMKEETE
jgi:hypothetical protein